MKDVPANRGWAAAGLLAVAAALLVVALNAPGSTAWYPACAFNSATGLYCPGCGGTRALHSALNGDVAGALRQNALVMAFLPLGAWVVGLLVYFAFTGKWKSPRILSGRWVWGIAVIVVVFGVVRNLPGFAFLAP